MHIKLYRNERRPWQSIQIMTQKYRKDFFFWYKHGKVSINITPLLFIKDNSNLSIGLSFLRWAIYLNIHGLPWRKSSKTPKEVVDAFADLFDELNEQPITDEEVDEELKALGIDPDELKKRFQEKIAPYLRAGQ